MKIETPVCGLRRMLVAICVSLSAVPLVSADTKAELNLDTRSPTIKSRLVGLWDVSLYFSPNQPPSATQMEISEVGDDGRLVGSFYQTEFEIARYTERNGVIVMTMITADGSGLYSTSGQLVADNVIEGQTLAHGRDFLMAWRAVRRP